VCCGLHKLHKLIQSTDKSAYVAIDLITKLRERNKLIRIADNSAGGWATVREYQSSESKLDTVPLGFKFNIEFFPEHFS
jgi:glycerol-3-phosphate responsive antiterminator